jgi:hypothetical protein
LWDCGVEGRLERSERGLFYLAARSGLGLAFCGRSSFAAALLEPVAVAVHLKDVYVMGKPVEQSAGEPFGAEDLGPFLEGQV